MIHKTLTYTQNTLSDTENVHLHTKHSTTHKIHSMIQKTLTYTQNTLNDTYNTQ